MTRIIAGSARGRRLQVPPKGTRPTASRARESLFSALESRGAIAGSQVLDLYAGSGALGLEALSRGAKHATFVDSSRQATQIAKSNARACNFLGQTAVKRADAGRYLQDPKTKFDLVFVDPPYQMPEDSLDAILQALLDFVSEGGYVVVERPSSSKVPTADGFRTAYTKKWGAAAAWILQKVGVEPKTGALAEANGGSPTDPEPLR